MYRKNSSSAYKQKVTCGTHDAVVTDVFFDPDFADNGAFRVNFRITTEDGEEFDYSELFYNTTANERTREFFDHLEANGIDIENITEFVGCKERVTIKKRVDSRGVARPSIVAREFVAHPEADTDEMACD